MPAPTPRMHGITHVPGGPDPIPGLVTRPGGGGLYETILELEPDGFWPLDETSGTIAHDVSGNQHHLTSVRGAIVWGQPAGPPGTLTPELHNDRLAKNTGDASHIELLGAADNFSAAVWMYTSDVNTALTFMGFGVAMHGTGLAGWQMSLNNSSYKYQFHYGSSPYQLVADNVLSASTWYLIGVSRDAGTLKLYVNGVQQAATSTAAVIAGGTFWLGSDDYNYPTGTFSLDGRLSYAAYWGSYALTAAEHAALYATGAGYVGGGVTWSHGTGNPGATVTSDYYLDTANGNVWFNGGGGFAKIWDPP